MSSDTSETDCSEELYADLSLEEDDTEECRIHPMLLHDIDLFKQFNPSEKITYRRLDEIQEIDIEMTVNLDCMKGGVLDAWDLCRGLPLILRVNLNSALYYEDQSLSKIDVFQDITKKQNGVLIQLKNIAKAYCQEQFSLYSKYDRKQNTLHDEGSDKLTKPSIVTNISNKSEENESVFKEGFFVQLHSYVQQRLETICDHCPICDTFHGTTSMLKPTVCSNALCVFSSQTMGVMSQITHTLATQPEVVDLLILFSKAALLASRHDLVLQPFPAVVDSESQEFLFSRDENGLSLLRKVMTKLSSIQLMGTSSESEIIDLLSSHHKYCYPLLRWIISSNRSHLMYLPKEKQLEMMGTNHQFLMRNSPPVEDANFRSLAKQFGSSFAFHGSPLENWHSIIRQGLVVASGTKLQLHGAIAGKGIYVTPHLNTALMYAGRMKLRVASTTKNMKVKENKDRISDDHLCVALCEVIMGPDMKKEGQKWIIRNSQYICTRFFFLYPVTNAKSDVNVDSTCSSFVESINTILKDS